MLTTLVDLLTLLCAGLALIIMTVLPFVMIIGWLRRPGLWRTLRAKLRPQPVAVTPRPSGGLPTLPQRRIPGGFERSLDRLLLAAATQPTSWAWSLGRWLLYALAVYTLLLAPIFGEQHSIEVWTLLACGFGAAIAVLNPGFKRTLARLTLHFGRTFPYVLRPWYWLSVYMRGRLAKRRIETAGSMFLRRMFSLERREAIFRPAFAIGNWVCVLLGLFYLPVFISNGIEAGYAWGSYPFGTYDDVVVTQAYRNITNQSTYSVHGYRLIDGVKHEYYFELGPNIWFWELYPEYTFGQLPILGRCTFDTYGITLRVPARLRLFSAGSLYALNPWIVKMRCTAPSIVPDR